MITGKVRKMLMKKKFYTKKGDRFKGYYFFSGNYSFCWVARYFNGFDDKAANYD